MGRSQRAQEDPSSKTGPTIPTVLELLAARAADEPDRPALAVAGRGSLTFQEWRERAIAMARGLAGRGVGPGDRIGLVFGGGEWLDFAPAFLAVLKAGAIAVPLSDRLPHAELTRLLAHCGASGVVRGSAAEFPSPPVWSVTPGELTQGPSGALEHWARHGDIAQILYTSGTTGRPKAVSATHANLTYGYAVRPRRRPFAHSRHLLHAFPIGTNAAQMMLVHALTATPAVLTLPSFTPERFARLIAEKSVGTVFLVPAMAMELLGAGVAERHDLSSVLLLGSAAAALPPAVAAGLAEAFPSATITNYYTSTEAAPAQTVMIYDPERPGALGRPAVGSDLRIADPAGDRLPAGRTGEVWLRTPGAPRAYYRDDRAGAPVFRDGWVRMGDLGYLDDEGYLFLVDRESDVVKSGAFKVSTIQVEAALYEHPGVREAAAFGVPHPVMGTTVAVAVVADPPVSLAGVRSFLRDRLAEHELPTRLLTVESLPRNTSGKVIKRELRELAESRPAVRSRSE